MRTTAALLVGLVMVAACDGLSSNAPRPPEPDSDAAWRVVRREPVRPFPQAKTVKLFVESGQTTSDGSVVFVSEEGRVLTPSERSTFESALEYVTYAGSISSAACFIPHHFFRYYDEAGKEIGEVSVCFCCAGFALEPGGPGDLQYDRADYAKLEKLVKDMGLPTDIECD